MSYGFFNLLYLSFFFPLKISIYTYIFFLIRPLGSILLIALSRLDVWHTHTHTHFPILIRRKNLGRIFLINEKTTFLLQELLSSSSSSFETTTEGNTNSDKNIGFSESKWFSVLVCENCHNFSTAKRVRGRVFFWDVAKCFLFIFVERNKRPMWRWWPRWKGILYSGGVFSMSDWTKIRRNFSFVR